MFGAKPPGFATEVQMQPRRNLTTSIRGFTAGGRVYNRPKKALVCVLRLQARGANERPHQLPSSQNSRGRKRHPPSNRKTAKTAASFPARTHSSERHGGRGLCARRDQCFAQPASAFGTDGGANHGR